MGFFTRLFASKQDKINLLAKDGTIESVVKLIKMQGQAARSGDIETLKTIISALRVHVSEELYVAAGETLPMNEQIEIANAVAKYRNNLT